jgi:hypothetical protein
MFVAQMDHCLIRPERYRLRTSDARNGMIPWDCARQYRLWAIRSFSPG